MRRKGRHKRQASPATDQGIHTHDKHNLLYHPDPSQSTIMSPILKKYKAAAVNAEPGWFNLEESVRRTIHWIDEAGKAGCKFIAFPELCECPGYDWLRPCIRIL